MPLTPINNISEFYNLLTSLLHFTPPRLLEIDILPSTSPPEIHFSAADSALGIPKTVLIPCFLHAREIFFGSVHGACRPAATGWDVERERGDDEAEAIYRATSVILLWEPNHHTAVNWRKRYLLGAGRRVADAELCFLESLLTSPLVKHTKAPTLWSHRLWLLRTFCWKEGGSVGDEGVVLGFGTSDDNAKFWARELDIVMRAGERHPRNYYAWEYARKVFSQWIWPRADSVIAMQGKEKKYVVESVERVREWCFSHPRDISGWSFLVWSLEKLVIGACWDEGASMATVRKIVWRGEEFVKKYDWKGESVEWFLMYAARLMREGAKQTE